MPIQERKSQLSVSHEENSMIFREVINIAAAARGIVEERRLWREKKRGIACYINGEKEDLPEFTFNPLNWQVAVPGPKDKIASVVVTIPHVSEGREVRAPLEKAISKLDESGVIILLERKSEKKPNKKNMKKFLKSLELVKGNIVTNKPDFIIWEGRIKKKAKKANREPKDYLHGGPDWWVRWLPALRKKLNDDFAKYGYMVISENEINDTLAHSTNFFRDYRKFIDGYGRKFEIACGCVWTNNIKGIISREPCRDPDCSGVPPPAIEEHSKLRQNTELYARRVRITKRDEEIVDRQFKAFVEKED